MKTIEEIIKQDPVFLNDWSEDGKFGVMCDFENIFLTKKDFDSVVSPWPNAGYWKEEKERAKNLLDRWENINILFASYGEANYSGDAWVLFEDGGKLYEVEGSHCSCYGLEGQWSPEEVALPEIENRLLKGTWGEDNWSDNIFKPQLMDFLGIAPR